MYGTSDNYKTYIKKPSRSFESKVIIGERTFDNSSVIQIVPNTIQPKNGFGIGNTVSQSIDITLKNDGGVYASIGKVDVSIALKMGVSLLEYIPIGIFNIDAVTKTDYTVKLTCYDNMIKFETGYFSSLGTGVSLQQVVDELKRLTGIDYDTTNWTIPSYSVTNLKGYTCREILGYVASICGGNAYITREGKFTVIVPKEVTYQVTADNYINDGYTTEDQTYKIGMITCQNKTVSENDESSTDYDSINEKNTISVGSLGSGSMELGFINPWVTESILNDIYTKIGGFAYLGYTMKWQGDMSLDIGDIITVIDRKNTVRKAFVYANKLTYNGGLVADTSAKGETKNSNSFNTVNSNTELDRISVKLLIAEKAIITKASISSLEAVNATIGNLQTSVATINTALIDYAKVDQLNATNANIDTLNTAIANINTALINKAEIADLNAANANISTLNADVANIQTLVNGNLTSANIQSLVLSSDKVTVNDGFIKNAMIESLAVDKINAGTLSTNKISIASDDGGLLIQGATQQFKDSSGKVRLQVGKDAEGNFDFVLVANDGTTTLIDGTGVHEGAISDGLIRTDMIADAAVTSSKIDYESVFSGFNAATNTTYVKASKVKIGLEDQTLDVAFNEVTNNVNTNTTSINAIQGQISTLISNTTITTDGNTIQLKDAYNGTVETVNSIDTILGEHESYINTETGQIETVISRLLSLRSGLDSIQLTLSSDESTINTNKSNIASLQLGFNDISTRLSSAESTITGNATAITSINQNLTTISQDVLNVQTKTTDLENSINTNYTSLTTSISGITANVTTLTNSITAMTIGARNYILASNFQSDIYANHWTLNSCDSIEEYNYNNYSYNALVCVNTTSNWLETSESIDGMRANTDYVFSCQAYGEMYIQITQVIYDEVNNKNDYKVIEIEVNNTSYEKIIKKFKSEPNVRYGYINIATPRNSTSKIALLQLETGTICSDWNLAPEDIEGSITQVYKETTSQISVLQDNISLKVSETDFTNGINSLQSQITLQAGQITSKVSANDVGTIITQSPTQVMTAFNKISTYFQVNSSGATFGDTSTGDYTTVGSYGIKHHIGGTDCDYMYITYGGTAVVEMTGDSEKEITVNFPQNIIAMLNGKVPKGISSVNYYYAGAYNIPLIIGSEVTNITSTSITLKAWFSTGELSAITSVTGGTYPSAQTNVYIVSGTNTGDVFISYIIIG